MKLTDQDLDRIETLGVGGLVTAEEQRALIAEVRRSREALQEVVRLARVWQLFEPFTDEIIDIAQAALDVQTSAPDQTDDGLLQTVRDVQAMLKRHQNSVTREEVIAASPDLTAAGNLIRVIDNVRFLSEVLDDPKACHFVMRERTVLEPLSHDTEQVAERVRIFLGLPVRKRPFDPE